MGNENVYKVMQNVVIQKLEEGIVPWRQSWCGVEPRNAVSNRPYRGFNIIWLACQGFSSPHWLTLKQCNQLKGKIKKGAKHTPILFWKMRKMKDPGGGDDVHIPVCRYYKVWNIEQTEGVEMKHPQTNGERRFTNTPIENCEAVIKGFKDAPSMAFGPNPAYGKGSDTVFMPGIESFESSDEYYSTLFHEFGHSTMHPTRLNRNSEDYAKEELIAEMASCFLCAVSDIDTMVVDNQVAYIQYWIDKIVQDSSLAVLAAGQAQKAADYILNNTFDEKGQLVLPPPE